MARLEGKRAIVTGAASGIGRASAVRFAAEGATVLAADLAEEGVAETVAQIEAAGGHAVAVAADAGDEDSVRALVERCVRDHGGLDVFYANAGIGGSFGSLFEASVDEWNAVLRVNLVGPFLAIKYGGIQMREQGSGSLICTASVAGLRSGAGPTP